MERCEPKHEDTHMDLGSHHSNRSQKQRLEAKLLSILAIIAAVLSISLSVFAGQVGTITAGNGINFRSSPNGSIKTALERGTRFTVLSQAGNWLKVQLGNGSTGFIYRPAGVELGAGTTTVRTDRGAQVGKIAGNYNLRSGPGSGNAVIRTLNRGDSFTALARSGNWIKIRTSNGDTGYVHLDGITEGSGMCLSCLETSTDPGIENAQNGAVDIMSHVQGSNSTLRCLNKLILDSAKYVVRNTYDNRSRSGGQCALGVRQSLQRAGLADGGLGNAIDYHSAGRLTSRGFKNRISQYNARNAPPGAVLVFKGPKNSTYQNSGRIGSPAGAYVGHVTIKGDDGKYYTDGRTADPAIANRELVGVYVLEDLSKVPRRAMNKCD